MTENPQFVDRDGPDNDAATYEDNNYRLWAGSPCIDTGINDDWMWSATDLDGSPRILDGVASLTVDMGAYEYARSFRIRQVVPGSTGGLRLVWASRPGDQYVIWFCADLASGSWMQGQTVPSAGVSTIWTDPSPGGSRKFYKVELK